MATKKQKAEIESLYETADYTEPLESEGSGPCVKCALYQQGCLTPKMMGSGSSAPHYLIIGEAPGEEEDEQGEPFVGKSGRFLREMLDAMEIDVHNVRFTNTVRCRPPENRTPSAKEINYCSIYLSQEIQAYQPDVIMLMGNAPLKAVLGESGITNWNGVVVNRGDYTYVPALHPSFLIRNGVPDELLDQWVHAFEQAKKVVTGDTGSMKSAEEDFEFVYPTTMEDLRKMFNALMKVEDAIAYDVEAKYLQPERPGNKILSVSLSNRSLGKVWSFPLYHQESWWDDKEKIIIVWMLKKILERQRIIGHNIGFDCKITRVLLGIEFDPVGDTMIVSQFLDSVKGRHGLKRLAGNHCGMFDYDKELEDYKKQHPECDYDKGGNYDNVPLVILLSYGAKDAVATLAIYEKLYPQLTDKQLALYHQMLMKAVVSLGRIEEVGFNLDKGLATVYEKVYRGHMDRLYKQMVEDPDVQRYIVDKEAELNKDWNGKRKWKTFTFNPNSNFHVADIFYDYKGHDVLGYTEKGLRSVSVDLLKQLKDKEPFFEPYRVWKLYSGVMSKNILAIRDGEWDWGDNRVHAHYNIGGTKTGRLSSSDPNMQNIPTPEKEPGTLLAKYPIKNLFIHTWKRMPDNSVRRIKSRTPGITYFSINELVDAGLYDHQYLYVDPAIDDGGDGCLMGADYGSMELRIMASLANVPGMLKAFEDDVDPHAYVTSMVFGIDLAYILSVLADKKNPDYERVKALRYRAKWVNWTLLFGGDHHTLFRLYGIPKNEAQEIMNLYYGKFPEILDFQQDIARQAKQNGYVTSIFGRVLHTPYINDTKNGRETPKAAEDRRTAMNFPIQSAASDTLLCALCIIDDTIKRNGYRTRIINTVHDSISFDIFPGEGTTIAHLTEDVMVNVPTYAKEYYPCIDFSWLCVNLKADVEFGHRYAQV